MSDDRFAAHCEGYGVGPLGDEREGLRGGIFKSYDEMTPDQQVAYKLGQSSRDARVGQLTQERDELWNLNQQAGLNHYMASLEAVTAHRDELEVRVGQLTQERDNAWAAAEQDQLWRESLLRRITELEAALLTALLKIEESTDEHDQKWASLIREHFELPVARLDRIKEEKG